MEFRELLYRARMGDQESIMEIFEMYRPLLVRNALVDGFFDEDLYQELIVEFLRCIRFFRDVTGMNEETIRMLDGQTISISKAGVKEFKSILLRFWEKQI